MKIVDVETTVVGTPWRDLTFVEVLTDDGLTGLGEVRMVNKTQTLVACIEELAPRYVIGSDPFDVERLLWNVQIAEYGRPGEVAMSALSALEVAGWDILGQALDVPVWKLIGGRFNERVRAYANGWYQAEREPSSFAEHATKVVERGYRAMKVDPFGSATLEMPAAELRRSVEIVAAVRDAVGPDVELMVEMHGRFSPATAIHAAKELEPLKPAWIEEPVGPNNASSFRRVKESTWLPVATGERIHVLSDFRQLIEEGLVDIIQADLTHFGGFLPMKRLAGWADAYYLTMAPHNVCGPVGTMANLHFAVATPNYSVLEHFNDFADPWVFGLVDGAPGIDAEDGCFAVPERSGLGVKLNHDACAEHPPTGGRITLFDEGWERRGISEDR
jgi:galactonate dehydratase